MFTLFISIKINTDTVRPHAHLKLLQSEFWPEWSHASQPNVFPILLGYSIRIQVQVNFREVE